MISLRRCSFFNGVNGEPLGLQMISAPARARGPAGEFVDQRSSQISALTYPNGRSNTRSPAGTPLISVTPSPHDV